MSSVILVNYSVAFFFFLHTGSASEVGQYSGFNIGKDVTGFYFLFFSSVFSPSKILILIKQRTI